MIPVLNWQLPSIATAAVMGILLNTIFLLVPAPNIDREFAALPEDLIHRLDV